MSMTQPAALQSPSHSVPSHSVLAAAVETVLRDVLARERESWSSVDAWMAEPFDLLADFVVRGGKRLRPCFFLYGLLGAGGSLEQEGVTEAAAALELLHAFALLHDDVMDGSDQRRGRPAFHRRSEAVHLEHGWRGDARRFGEGLAVLIGDLAFACADSLVARLSGAVRVVWRDLTAELVMGQFLDIAGAARGGVDPRRAERIARFKSGAYTVERPLHIGAALAGWLPELRAAYSAIGRPLGEAFQFRDDLLGVFGDARLGKPIGEDLREGKPTLLLAVARELAGASGTRLLGRVGSADLNDHEVSALRSLLEECGARRFVEAAIRRRYDEAMTALERAPIVQSVRPAMADMAERCLWRDA